MKKHHHNNNYNNNSNNNKCINNYDRIIIYIYNIYQIRYDTYQLIHIKTNKQNI